MVLRLLAVGDGDLSFSLALKRAYPHLDLIASTLVESSEELSRTYSNASANEAELRDTWGVSILFHVDATRLDKTLSLKTSSPSPPSSSSSYSFSKFDLILFNHPHLGDATLAISEKLHAERHYSLLCHYFHSAKRFLNDHGRIHVCLCGTQAITWDLYKAAKNNGLTLICQQGTEAPVESWIFYGDFVEKDDQTINPAPVQKHYPCPRRYRNGKLGSKHYLGKYGYRHRRTGGDLFRGNDSDMSVHQSVNYIFERQDVNINGIEVMDDIDAASVGVDGFVCEICGMVFEKKCLLDKHLDSPAVPDILTNDSTSDRRGTIRPRELQDSTSTSRRDVTISATTLLSSSDDGNQINHECIHSPLDRTCILTEGTVDGKFDSTRIKWLCRQKDFHSFSNYISSKKQCVDAISQGRIYVNGIVALDSGRIVREKDVITLIDTKANNPIQPASTVQASPIEDSLGCRIVEEIPLQKDRQWPRLVVVYKPVGIRVVGSFSPNTLEMITKRLVEEQSSAMENLSCAPLSKLDTGCAGLCVFLMDSKGNDLRVEPNVQITYTFTALVHGRVPEEWRRGVYVQLPRNGTRMWKRQKGLDELSKNCDACNVMDYDEKIEITRHALDLDKSIFIMSKDGHSFCNGNDNTCIETLEISSRHGSGKIVNTISFILRKIAYPMINDRFCKREFASLPRRMRNILKQKICIGCYSVCVHLHDDIRREITVEPHRRTQASFWRQTMSTALDGSTE